MHLLLTGTKKGLFLFTSADRQHWEIRGPFLQGKEVHHAVYDLCRRRIFATSNDAWFGSEIVYSDDLGETWIPAKCNPAFAENAGVQLERIWHIEPGHTPNVVYAGVAPAALFRSSDSGETWSEVTELSRHPTRERWNPGAGGLCLHSIQLDPANEARMFVGISAVGVFRTEDGGASWTPANRGTRAQFLPDPLSEFGQCVHKPLMAPGHSDVLFQQNHCGVYRNADAGRSWEEITAGLPSNFGFPLAVHPRDPETVYVIPLQGSEFRCPPDEKLRVFRTRDSGKNWEALTKGLSQENAFASVLREGMATDACEPAGIYILEPTPANSSPRAMKAIPGMWLPIICRHLLGQRSFGSLIGLLLFGKFGTFTSMRTATIERNTNETRITAELNLDGTGVSELAIGIPFFEHMLDQVARHGLFDLKINAAGDLDIDDHHTIEDTGIVLGQAFNKAIGDKKGIYRYGEASVPLDEALSRVVIDFSGRPGLEYHAVFPRDHIGKFDADLIREFFSGFVNHAGVTLHIDSLRGTNAHHIAETIFKAFGRAARFACETDPRRSDSIPSTKGVL